MIMAGWLGIAAAAAAEQAASGGHLLYSRLTEGTWQIWKTDVSTHERQQLTFTPGDKRYPAKAGEDQISYCTSNQACVRARLGETAGEPLLQDLWPIRDVAWSPDGAHMAFSRFRTDLQDSANIWIAETSGANPRMLTHEVGVQQQPAWSPDGRWLAYSGGHGYQTYEIYVVSVDGEAPRQLTKNQAHEFLPAWSPDGQQIAFSSDRSGNYDIWVMNADGSAPRQLTTDPALDTRPTWSPDGHSIAFATNRSGRLELWVMQADGAGQQLLETSDEGACDPAWR